MYRGREFIRLVSSPQFNECKPRERIFFSLERTDFN